MKITKESYNRIKEKHPVLFECFFAFSNEQFQEGKISAGIEDRKIHDGGHGLYGTKKGIAKLFSDYDEIDKEVAEKCDPQEVYQCEFDNHECSYTNDDREAIEIVVRIFNIDKAKTVKRKFGYIEIV